MTTFLFFHEKETQRRCNVATKKSVKLRETVCISSFHCNRKKKRKSSLVRQSVKALSLFFSSLITRRVCTLQPMQNERTGSLFKRGNSQYGGGGKQPAEVTIPNISRNTERQLHSTLPAAIYNPCTPFVVAVEGDKEGEESKHLVVERERLS